MISPPTARPASKNSRGSLLVAISVPPVDLGPRSSQLEGTAQALRPGAGVARPAALGAVRRVCYEPHMRFYDRLSVPSSSNRHRSTASATSENRAKLVPRSSQVAPSGHEAPGQMLNCPPRRTQTLLSLTCHIALEPAPQVTSETDSAQICFPDFADRPSVGARRCYQTSIPDVIPREPPPPNNERGHHSDGAVIAVMHRSITAGLSPINRT